MWHPALVMQATLSRSQGIPETVSLAVSANKERKPVWLCIQAFEGTAGDTRSVVVLCYKIFGTFLAPFCILHPGPRFYWTMPTERQLRIQAYAGVVHGATGIIYFALDPLIQTMGAGIAPQSNTATGVYNGQATDNTIVPGDPRYAPYRSPALINASESLWRASTVLNAELTALAPALFSPTSSVHYSVAFAGHNYSTTPIRTLLKNNPHVSKHRYTLLAVNVDATVRLSKEARRR